VRFDRIVILTGAGLSAESGLGTFRDKGGLWSQFPLEEVATPEGFARNPARVHDFYNLRRRRHHDARPNAAHAALARLEREHAGDFASGFIAESPDKLRLRLSQYFAALLGRGDFAPNNCNAPWVSSVIEADGTVRPCFFQPPLGNIHRAGDGGLASILNSDEAVAWRRGLDTHRDAICQRCVCTLSLSTVHAP